MDPKIAKFFKKNKIEESNIKYITREDQKTQIYLVDGCVVQTYIPMKVIHAELNPNVFLNINKSITIAKSFIFSYDHGIYTMIDGKRFYERVRAHSPSKKISHNGLPQKTHRSYAVSRDSIRNQFKILDNSPLAFCVTEVIHTEDGLDDDIIFIYANKQMERFDMKQEDSTAIIGQSFYDLFPNGNRKWIHAFMEIAINGGQRVIRDFSPELGIHLEFYCFQPEEGFCACTLIESPK